MNQQTMPPAGGATVIRFPLHRNIGKARRVADVFARRREGKDQESYWRRTCCDLAAMLQRNGADDAEIDRHIDAFRDVVSAILSNGQPLRGGGDAA